LEEGEPANQTLPFAQWLSNEVKQANTIKRDMPIMCVIGNPPYSGISQNMGGWISGLIEDYKYIDGEHFGERKHWLHDDYVKFIRLSEHLIEKNGEGVLGFITNHGYLDNPTFRGMRWHLLNTFDKVYVLDLHGNSKKKEVTPEGETDKNVFDIQQGVAIIIALKKAREIKGACRGISRRFVGRKRRKIRIATSWQYWCAINNKDRLSVATIHVYSAQPLSC
jgi:predicted helicase